MGRKDKKNTCGNCLWRSSIYASGSDSFNSRHGFKFPCRSVATKAIEVYEDDDACPAHSSLSNPEGNSQRRNPDANCGNCPYWDKVGICRRLPSFVMESGCFLVEMKHEEWCGQHPDFWNSPEPQTAPDKNTYPQGEE